MYDEEVVCTQLACCSLSCQPFLLNCSVICILQKYRTICAFVPSGPALTYYSVKSLIEQYNGFQTTAFHIPCNLITT